MIFIERIKKIWTVLLALTGIFSMLLYLNCTSSCTYLKGEVLGVDLKYMGIAFMVFVIFLVLSGWDSLLRIALAAGIGGELFLIGYQIHEQVFCPYCLVFAVALILAFIVNYRPPVQRRTGWMKLFYLLGEVQMSIKKQKRTIPLSLCTIASFLFFVLAFSGSPVPAYAAELNLPALYGSGPVEVRIYSDYFCSPCQSLENDSELIIDQLVARKKARILFIDTPVHQETAMYARYFIYSAWNDPGYAKAKSVRKLLFSAAKEKIENEAELMKYLHSHGVRTPMCQTADYFKALNGYIKQDKIHSTPTCVIVTKEGKSTYHSPGQIVDALQNLLKK
jgi:uncharacterized membrane protein/protein-disulfide isomerase